MALPRITVGDKFCNDRLVCGEVALPQSDAVNGKLLQLELRGISSRNRRSRSTPASFLRVTQSYELISADFIDNEAVVRFDFALPADLPASFDMTADDGTSVCIGYMLIANVKLKMYPTQEQKRCSTLPFVYAPAPPPCFTSLPPFPSSSNPPVLSSGWTSRVTRQVIERSWNNTLLAKVALAVPTIDALLAGTSMPFLCVIGLEATGRSAFTTSLDVIDTSALDVSLAQRYFAHTGPASPLHSTLIGDLLTGEKKVWDTGLRSVGERFERVVVIAGSCNIPAHAASAFDTYHTSLTYHLTLSLRLKTKAIKLDSSPLPLVASHLPRPLSIDLTPIRKEWSTETDAQSPEMSPTTTNSFGSRRSNWMGRAKNWVKRS